MTTVTILFRFSDGAINKTEFDASSGILSDIEDRAEEVAAHLQAECDGWEVWETELDCDDQMEPNDFPDLNEWGEYCDLVDKHGEAFCLRYADIGEHDFDEEYNGCWDSVEDFVQNLIDDCYDLQIPSFVTVDWERTARDVLMDFSEYSGSEGIHIFRD